MDYLIDMNYEYDGRICGLVNTFIRPITSKNTNSFAIVAAVVMLDGECKTVEWKSLRAKPVNESYRNWRDKHMPIEYFGATIASILAENGMDTMSKIDFKKAADCYGIGDVYLEKIDQGIAKYRSDFGFRTILDEIETEDPK